MTSRCLKKKKILNKTNKNCSQRNVKHSQVERNQPRGRPRFKENKFSIKEARKLLTPQRTLNSFPISYRLKQLKKITYTKKKNKTKPKNSSSSILHTLNVYSNNFWIINHNTQRGFISFSITHQENPTESWKSPSSSLFAPLISLAVTHSFPPLEKEMWWRSVYLKFSSV